MKRTVEATDIIHNGRQMPNAEELEYLVIGTILTERGAFDKIATILEPGDFYNETCNEVFKAALKLYLDKTPIDSTTVMAQLRKVGKFDFIGIATYSELPLRSSLNIEYNAHIIKQKAMVRKTISILGDGLNSAYDDVDPFDFITKLLVDIEKNIDLKKTQIQHISRAALKVFEQMDTNKNQGSELIGLPSCLSEVNKKLLGYAAPDLIILAARPGEGKTTLAVNEAFTIAKSGSPVLFFSMEMKGQQIAMKVLSSLAETDVLSIRSGKISEQGYSDVAYHVEKSMNIPFYIVDASGLSTMEIKAITKSAVKEYGIKKIFVDYIQIAKGSKNNYSTREQEVSDIAKDLKGIAMECEIPVMALSQMARGEKGVFRMPQLSDLKESGGLEANADIVMFITRPHYHGVSEVKGFEMNFGENDALFLVAKYRLGSTGATLIKFEGQYNRFSDFIKTTNFIDYTQTDKDYDFTDRSNAPF